MKSSSSLLVAGIAAGIAALAGAQTPGPIDACHLPRIPVVDLPFTNEGNTCEQTNTASSYGGACTIQGANYSGPDAIYEIVLNEGNQVGFALEALDEVGDFVLALLDTCGDGTTCVANSPDFIGNDTEEIATGERDPGVYYLYVDSPSRCGPYRLRITGTNPRPSADLAAELAASAHPAVAGRRLLTTLRVHNHGPENAYGVTATQELPAGAELVRLPPDCQTRPPGAFTCRIESLPANTSRDFEVPFDVFSSTRGTFSTNATVPAFTVADSDSSNNAVPLGVPIVGRVDLRVDKSGDPDPVTAGESLTYTLEVTNVDDGPSDATSIEVTDELPPEATLRMAPGACREQPAGRVVCAIGTLAPGESSELRLAVDVASSAETVIRNRAEVTSAETERLAADNVRLVSTTVERRVELRLRIAGPDESVVAGSGDDNLTHVLTVVNNGPSDASGLVITDTFSLPEDVTVSVTPSRGNFADGVWHLGDLTAGAVETLRAVFTVGPSAPNAAVVRNRADVSLNEPNDGDVVARESTSVRRETDLELVTKTADPDPVVAGETLTYTLTVANHGPSDSTGGTIDDPLPNGLTFDSSPDGCTESGGTVTCPVPDLPHNGVAVRRFNALVASSAITAIENTATVEGNEDEPADATRPNSATSSTTVTALTDLGLTKSADRATVVAGEALTYTLTVTNHGPSDSTGGTIEDPLREGVAFVSSPDGCTAAEGVVTCTVGPLARNDSAAFHFDGRVESAAVADLGLTEIENTATVAGNEPEPPDGEQPNQFHVTTAVTAETDLRLAKSADPETVVAGKNLTYTLTVKNDGPSVSTGSTVRDALTEGLTFVSSLDGCKLADGEVTCAVGPLAPGEESPIFRFVAAVSSSVTGAIANAASVEGNEPEPQDATEPNDAAVSRTVETESDLAVTVIDDPDPVAPEGELRYGLTVSNRGPSDATDLLLVDTLPEAVTFGDAPSCNQVDDPDNPGTMKVECAIPRLPAGESAVFTITGTVAAEALSPLRNETVLTAAGDPVVTVEAYTTVAAEGADLAVTQSESIDPVVAGDRLTYTLTIANRGPDAASTVMLTDQLPNDTAFAESSSYCTLEDQSVVPFTLGEEATGTVDLGELSAGGSVACVVAVDVDLSAAGPLVNIAEVTGENDPNAADPEAPDFNNRSEEETAVLAVAPLVLPYFAVSANDPGKTTLLTVHNGAETDVRLRVDYVAGAESTMMEEPLPSHGTRVVDLRGLALPTDDLGDATGYAAITALDAETGEPLPRAEQELAGYFFLIDPGCDFASGHPLVDTDSSRRPPGLCRAWDTRFLNGGGLAGETDFLFFTPAVPDEAEAIVVGEVYTEAGDFVQEIPIQRTEHAFKIGSRQPEIDLRSRFGAVEWRFRDDVVGYVASVFKAGGTAVGLPGFCKEPRTEDTGGDLLLPHFGDLAELAMFLAVRNGGGDKATVSTQLFSASGEELGDAEDVTLGAHATHTVELRQEAATNGYAVVERRTPAAVLHGDAFRLDPAQELASGDALVELDSARRPPALCQRWDVVFFHGEGFDDSEFLFYVAEGEAAENLDEIITGRLYREDGTLVGAVPVTPGMEERRTFTRRLDELFPNLVPDAGTLEWEFRDGVTGHVSAVFTRGKYSVTVPGICRDAAGMP